MVPCVLGLGLSLWITSCSPSVNPDAEANNPVIESAEPEIPPTPEPPLPPLPELTIVFEFEGIAPKLITEAILASGQGLRVRQELLRFDTSGAPVTRGDIYVLSPRTIPHFIARGWVVPITGEVSLEQINPTFTFHRFDPGNRFSVPFRWTPVISLQTAPSESETNSPSTEAPPKMPADSPVASALGLSSLAEETPEEEVPSGPPTLPDPDAYREAWDAFVSGSVSTVWMPAACPLRNIGKQNIPSWKWKLPGDQTVIFFDHLLIDNESDLANEAKAIASHLISREAQSQLPQTSGYFPVVSPLGREKSASPIPLPQGEWLQNSSFITGVPFFPPPPAEEPEPLNPPPPQPVPQTVPPE